MVIVTGGGSGIGRCTAHELASLGTAVALIGRTRDKLERVCAEIAQAGGKASAHVCDIREEDAVKGTVAEVLTQHGHIDGLVNNAGGQFPAPLASISAKGWDTVVRNNLTGGFLMARECYTQWMARACRPAAPSSTSSPTCGWACRGWGIRAPRARACSISPRPQRWNGRRCASTRSPRAGSPPAAWITTAPKCARASAACISMCRSGRLGTESEVSAAIVFLLSPAAAFISGSCLRVDGAVPNARRSTPLAGKGVNAPFNAFLLAQRPKVLDEDA